MKIKISIAIVLIILAGCSIGTSEVIASDFELPEMVEVTFQSLVPKGTDVSRGISFTLLDSLTGEEINAKYLLMDQEGDRSFSVTISVVRHSLIRYRYEKGEIDRIREADSAGLAIQNRFYYVDGPGHVATDIISSWEGQDSGLDVGSVRGHIFNAESNESVENLIINISGQQTRSDQAGNFLIIGLVQGLHNIVVYSETGEYLTFQQGALIAAALETPAEITIHPSQMIKVNFIVNLPKEHVPGVPVFLISDLAPTKGLISNGINSEGQLLFSAEYPAGIDIRYKYSMGDSFWNAEHLANGEYLTRQLVLGENMDGLIIHDGIAIWTAGNSAPIWFEVQNSEAGQERLYIQFKFTDWTPAIQMWGLGDGVFAYKLNSPTNFAAALEYRYCQDSFCLNVEDFSDIRNVHGNMERVQYIEDQIKGWK